MILFLCFYEAPAFSDYYVKYISHGVTYYLCGKGGAFKKCLASSVPSDVIWTWDARKWQHRLEGGQLSEMTQGHWNGRDPVKVAPQPQTAIILPPPPVNIDAHQDMVWRKVGLDPAVMRAKIAQDKIDAIAAATQKEKERQQPQEPPLIPSYPETILMPARSSQILQLCFVGETPICMNEADCVPIQDIRIGDRVESCDANGCCELKPVKNVFKSKTNHLIHIAVKDQVLRSTEDHPFYLASWGEYRPAKELRVGDELTTLDQKTVIIDRVDDEYGDFDVFNIDVDQNHNYYACGILVHNCNQVWSYAKDRYYQYAYPRIGIPHSDQVAYQSGSEQALEARTGIELGRNIYRAGTRGKSETGGEAQFWAMDHPQSPQYRHRYGIPSENMSKADFIEIGHMKKGTPFITRHAPPALDDLTGGGGIEVVVPKDGVNVFAHYSF